MTFINKYKLHRRSTLHPGSLIRYVLNANYYQEKTKQDRSDHFLDDQKNLVFFQIFSIRRSSVYIC